MKKALFLLYVICFASFCGKAQNESGTTLIETYQNLMQSGQYDEARLYMAMFFAAHELNDHGSFVIGVCKGSEKLIKGNVAEDKYLCVYGVD